MKINLSTINPTQFDLGQFYIRDNKYDVESPCFLIKPKLGFTDWTEGSLIFRSSVWTANGNLISAGFPKFFNLYEKPEIHPLPDNLPLDTITLVEKIDGSCLIVSKYKNNLLIRTRGSVNALSLPNGKELLDFVPLFKSYKQDQETWNESLIFEWYSPKNKIVINYGNNTTLTLIGAINHSDYSLFLQKDLDMLALDLKLPRPKYYTFKSFSDLLNFINNNEQIEGICIYYDNDQHIKKLKTLTYLKLHAFKSDLSFKSLVDLFLQLNKPTREEFEKHILQNFDYECLNFAKSTINSLYASVLKVNQLLSMIRLYVGDNEHLTQPEFAELTKVTFDSFEQNIAYKVRRFGNIDDNTYKQIILQKYEK